MVKGGHAWRGRDAWQGGCMVCTAGHCAGGTHPTGMHSCTGILFSVSFVGNICIQQIYIPSGRST